MRNIARVLFPLLLALTLAVLAGCNFSLAEDVTPPPGWHPTPVPPTPEVKRLYPLTPPDPRAGADIYRQYCIDCHGPQAQGDGQLADQLPEPPAPLADPTFDADATPADWFLTITQGRMEALMPAFGDKLSEAQRWDVIAYLMTLRYDQESARQGEEVYALRCASCHGPNGQAADLRTWQTSAGLSAARIRQAALQGHQDMQPVEGVSPDDLDAVIAYIRRAGMAAPAEEAASEPTAQPSPTPEGTASPSGTAQPTEVGTTPTVPNEVTIKGTVTLQGDEAKPLPGVTVVLHGFDNDAPGEVIHQETTTDEQGRFVFEHVPAPFHRVFVASVEYGGASYGSDWAVATGDPVLQLPVTVYETTTDTSALRVDRLHLFFEFPTPDTLRVLELYVISNTGKKTVVPPQDGEPVITFAIPQGATNLEFQDGALGAPYLPTEDGFGDPHPIPPGNGSYQIVFAYELPYDKKAEVRHAVTLPVDAAALLAPADIGVKVESPMMEDSGIETIEGQPIHVYQSGALQPGDEVVFTVRGRPREGGAEAQGSSTRTGLAVGLVAFGLGLIVTGLVLYRRQQTLEAEEEEGPTEEDLPDDPETLMDAILALDDLYKEGRLNEEAYRTRRAALKARLAALLEGEGERADEAASDEGESEEQEEA